jgi:hypothetical protein
VHSRLLLFVSLFATLTWAVSAQTQSTNGNPSTSRIRKPEVSAPGLDAGSVSKGIYRNPSFGFTCKIPEGWVLRTDVLNTPEDEPPKPETVKVKNSDGAARVLLAAFARPPEAHGEDINSSILIAAESAATYPGLTTAAQYFGPIGEVAKAQGLELVEDPYETTIGAKTVDRADFQKDVGTRRMWQSTIAILARGHVVSFTFIGGTEDEIEDLVGGLSFTRAAKPQAH